MSHRRVLVNTNKKLKLHNDRAQHLYNIIIYRYDNINVM